MLGEFGVAPLVETRGKNETAGRTGEIVDGDAGVRQDDAVFLGAIPVEVEGTEIDGW